MRTAGRGQPNVWIVWALRLILVVIVVGGWFYANVSGAISTIILPPLGEVLVAAVGYLGHVEIWSALGVTVVEMVVGFVIAAVAGLAVGLLLSRTPLNAAVSKQLLGWGYIFPISLVYPLFLVWAGVGIPSKILFAAVSAFFPIAYNTVTGLAVIPDRYLAVGRAFGGSGRQIDLHIRLGAARPMILSGLRLGVSMTTISVIIAELLGANAGLGFLAQQASNQFQITNSYALILILVVMTSLLIWMMEWTLKDRRTLR